MGGVGASTVKKKVVPQWDRCLSAALWVVCSSDCQRRAESLLFPCEHGPEVIPKVRRRETCSAAVTVTDVLSWGRGVGGPAAGRSVPGCGCSRGGRSGSGGPRGERDRGNSDALWAER